MPEYVSAGGGWILKKSYEAQCKAARAKKENIAKIDGAKNEPKVVEKTNSKPKRGRPRKTVEK